MPPLSAPPLLFGIAYSPWTEKARWALDHCGVGYRYREHIVMLGMPELRLRTGRLTGDLTVPALVGRDARDRVVKFFDSYDIARYADAHRGSREPLFPKDHETEIQEYNAVCEAALDAGRALSVARMADSRGAQLESVPPFIPGFLRAASLPLVRMGLGYILKEFAIDRAAEARHLDKLRAFLNHLRAELKRAGGSFLLGRFSYADIVMAMPLHFVEPGPGMPLGSHSRACWTCAPLMAEFADLVAWRNSLYETHRHDVKR